MFGILKKFRNAEGISVILFLKRAVLVAVAFTAIVAIGCGVYCWHISGEIEKKFSGRKWKIPSTVYSDTMLLFPGQSIIEESFLNKLKRLRYQRRETELSGKGEYRYETGMFEIYLNDLSTPGNHREGFPVRLTLQNSAIQKITDLRTNESVSILELEPEEVMQFFDDQREVRTLVNIRTVPPHLIHAVMAAEDNRFYSHMGVDPVGIIRALYTNIRYGYIRQGGSTLTQQLVKNYFLTPERTFRRKINEVLIAFVIELKYEKDEILEIYLNEIYFGQKGSVSVSGVGEAAEFYFGKPVENLTLSESALIAGMIKGPNLYSPYSNMERCLTRRNQVLNQMQKKGWITEEDKNRALTEEVVTAGFEKYSEKAPYFLDYVSDQLRELYSLSTLSSMGFSIYTTLDMTVQIAVEKALEKGLSDLEKKNASLKRDDPAEKLQGAVIVMQPRTGNILAMAGGRDYRVSQFNRATRAKRQSGSCFKPIVVASYLDVFRPSDMLSNEKIDYIFDDKLWSPDNFNEIKRSTMSVRDMLTLSCNRAAVDLLVQGGLDNVLKGVSRFKFTTEFKAYPSIALGAFEVVPVELARAYCAFAADGIQPYPLSLKDVVDETNTLLVGKHVEIEPVMSPAKAFLVSSMLESVVQKGTAKSLKKRGINFSVSGKTGTTNDFRDAWFIGYTPDLLVLVWVGFDNGDKVHFTGSQAALPIWADIVNSVPEYVSGKSFIRPEGVVTRDVCSESGELPIRFKCQEVYEEYFLEGNVPQRKCSVHGESGIIGNMFNKIKKLFK